MKKRITEEECKELFDKYNTPKNVIGHCMAVSKAGVIIATALNNHGFSFDLDLVRSAGMIHDLCRVMDHHGERCAEILENLGFYDEAEIVKVHMYHSFNDFAHLTETDMVCLGDRLVKEDKYVGLDERIDYLIHKRGENPARTRKILENKKITQELIDKINNEIGQTIDSLFLKGDR